MEAEKSEVFLPSLASAQRHQIRKAGDGGNTLVAVFLTFAEKHLLLLYRPSMVQGQLSLAHLKTLYPPQVSSFKMFLVHSHITHHSN